MVYLEIFPLLQGLEQLLTVSQQSCKTRAGSEPSVSSFQKGHTYVKASMLSYSKGGIAQTRSWGTVKTVAFGPLHRLYRWRHNFGKLSLLYVILWNYINFILKCIDPLVNGRDITDAFIGIFLPEPSKRGLAFRISGGKGTATILKRMFGEWYWIHIPKVFVVLESEGPFGSSEYARRKLIMGFPLFLLA